MSFPNYTVMGVSFNVFTVLVCLFIGGLIACHTFCGSAVIYNTKKAGFLDSAPLNSSLSNNLSYKNFI